MKKTLYSTIEEPSLNNDSPATIAVTEAGAPSSLSIATTATGSVAASSAPNVHDSIQSQ